MAKATTACVPWSAHRDKHQRPPWLLKGRSSVSFITFVASFAVFTDSFLYGLIVPVIPSALNERLHVSANDEQKWTSILLALYGAAQFSFAPLNGYLSDRIQSRWWPMVTGVLILGAGTALLCAGTNIGLWIAGRILQGAAAAIVWTAGCALLADTVADEQLGHAMGYISTGMTLGNLTGPLVGGAVYEHGGYHSVFIVAFALIGVDMGLRLVMIETKQAVKFLHTPAEQTTVQSESAAIAEPPAVLPENGPIAGKLEPPSRDGGGSETPASRASLKAACRLLSSPRILVVIWTCVVVSVIISAFDSVLPLFVQDTFKWAQTAQGLIFIPFVMPSLLGPLVGWVNDRYPKLRRFLAGGALLISAPPCLLLRLVSGNDIGHKVLMCALLVVLGMGMAVLFPLVLAENSYAASEQAQEAPSTFGEQGVMGLAYGFANSAYAAGSIAGPFLAGFIRASAGWGTMTLVLGLLTGVSALPVLLYFGGFKFCNKGKGKP
ncbi:hypothetical protein P175DRAFT_0438021 [Aspergillus ochraceoroseus IBT 24754]|uniref:Major facilitator superfamily (MFS) profile domain-containing protein n=2 Tax=Aspergillus ochraceoroseus TaxID=138278 RepID=A0A2T5LY12_9EURO|nr:uncharacterized protein P175DRAFT_0438021 [Aspergillus ochraceoroseus IBT 24754]KKK18739.1 hypothetical protein AOCH_000578 [Aspergillus ochraceoroseus]PTU21178.1 hypothetical protein P175DRAFT_0438021 [Aspergillus ochraceoroseus IBT 24754]